jgi:mono/diheme cytochrome c family protein
VKTWTGWLIVLGAVFAPALAAQDDDALVRGKTVYDHYCYPCHGVGAAKAGTTVLQYRYKGEKPALLAERTDLTPAVVKAFVRNGVALMAKFRKTEITDAELDDLAAYVTRKDKSKP